MPYAPLYIAADDLAETIPQDWIDQMTDDVDGEVTGDTALLSAIRWAETRIDEALRGRYTLPLAIDGVAVVPIATEDNPGAPDSLRDIAMDLATYRVHQRRFTDAMPKNITERFQDALKRLDNIRDGLTVIVADVDEPAVAARAPFMVTYVPTRILDIRDRL